MTKANINAALLAGVVILLISLGCGRTQTEKTGVDEKSDDSTTSKTNEGSEPTRAETSAPTDISGKYDVTGKNENGGDGYEATLEVTKRDEVYQFSWDTAGKKMDGVGVQKNSTVAVAFTEGSNGKGCGVVLYQLNPDGSLDGTAGYWGTNQKETEKAVRTSGNDDAGEYDVEGANPEGKNYKAKLTVKKVGAGYTFSWSGANAFEGFGIRQDDTIAVGFGGKQCGFVSYRVEPDGTLEGKWGGYGTTSVGSETAKKT